MTSLLLWLTLVDPVSADTWEAVKAVRADDSWQTPDAARRAAYGELVAALAEAAPRGAVPDDAPRAAADLGLTLVRKGDVIVLAEQPDLATGLGLVALRLGPLPAELVLQAPHPWYDLRTGRLVASGFDRGGVRAVCIATAHRNAAEDSDPSHATTTGMQSATDALAKALVDLLVVQLHGFAADTSPADVVVSTGSSQQRPGSSAAAAHRIGAVLGLADVRVGDDVPSLAARDNVQGQLLAGRTRFLHVELSVALREDLSAHPERLLALRDALLEEAARAPEVTP